MISVHSLSFYFLSCPAMGGFIFLRSKPSAEVGVRSILNSSGQESMKLLTLSENLLEISTNSTIVALILEFGVILWLVAPLLTPECAEFRYSRTSDCIISAKVFNPSFSSSLWSFDSQSFCQCLRKILFQLRQDPLLRLCCLRFQSCSHRVEQSRNCQ